MDIYPVSYHGEVIGAAISERGARMVAARRLVLAAPTVEAWSARFVPWSLAHPAGAFYVGSILARSYGVRPHRPR